MIDPTYCQMMARYNIWQNQSLIAAADTLSDDQRRLDRGAFFGSIFATLNHLLWADSMWMHRFQGDPPAEGLTPADSLKQVSDWLGYSERRNLLDRRIFDWANRITSAELVSDISYFSTAASRQIVKPFGLIAVHMFNHQTHHRGQVHAMLTAAGAKPDDTDLPFMPEEFAAL